MLISLVLEVHQQICVLVSAKDTLGKRAVEKTVKCEVRSARLVKIIQLVALVEVLRCARAYSVWFCRLIPAPNTVVAVALVDTLLAVE